MSSPHKVIPSASKLEIGSHPKSVHDIMTTKLVTFYKETPVLSAIDTLLKNQISGAPVVDENNAIVGILSEIDAMATLIQSSYHKKLREYVRDFMSTDVIAVSPEMGIMDLAELFLKKHFRRFPVVKNGKLIGQVSRRDVLRAILVLSKEQYTTPFTRSSV